MAISLVRTDAGFFVERDGRFVAVATDAATTGELLEDRAAIDAAATSRAKGVALDPESLLSPVTTPCRVVAQMVNYRSHARDSGMDPDQVPVTFFRKASGSVAGPRADVVRPAHVRLLDYEVELGLVIGTHVPVGTRFHDTNLADFVAGLVIANDVSARDVQLPKTQFYESKSYPTFTPLGPRLVLTTEADLRRLRDLRLTLEVDGNVRQNSTLSDMISPPAPSLTTLSRFQELAPGDVVLTGTPGGTALRAPSPVVELIGHLLPPRIKWRAFFQKQQSVPAYLQDGQVMTARIATDDGALDLGTQRNRVRCPS